MSDRIDGSDRSIECSFRYNNPAKVHEASIDLQAASDPGIRGQCMCPRIECSEEDHHMSHCNKHHRREMRWLLGVVWSRRVVAGLARSAS